VAEELSLAVLTPSEILLDVPQVEWVQLELADGGIRIYPGHISLLAETVTAPLRYADAAGEHGIELAGGILYVRNERVTILTRGRAAEAEVEPEAEPEEEVRFERLARALEGLDYELPEM
jgi:F0F1-type ATP synthase epsilon subunit